MGTGQNPRRRAGQGQVTGRSPHLMATMPIGCKDREVGKHAKQQVLRGVG